MVRHGRVLTAPHLGTEAWAGYDLQTELSRRWGKPVRVMNDADVQGFGAIRGVGVEMVVTLGTGCGTAIFDDGKVIPHLELSHHPIRSGQTYDEYVGRAALDRDRQEEMEPARRAGHRRAADRGRLRPSLYRRRQRQAPQARPAGRRVDRPEQLRADRRVRAVARDRCGAAGARPHAPRPQPDGDRRDAADPGRVRRARGRLRLPCACLRHGGAVSVCRSARLYAAARAGVNALSALLRALHLSRVVIVQPSVYGTDNSCTLDGMRRLGAARARGVAVIGEATSDAELDAMHRAGIRGVRVNLETAGESDPDLARRLLADAAARVAGRGWHVQVYTRLPVIAALSEEVARLPVPVVFDHFGGAQAAGGVGQPGFSALLDLVRAGHAYVKVSAAYRSSNAAPAYADVAPLARALIDANPERIVWGSDWPHPHAAAPGSERRRADAVLRHR